jgi:hypothetical protein
VEEVKGQLRLQKRKEENHENLDAVCADSIKRRNGDLRV